MNVLNKYKINKYIDNVFIHFVIESVFKAKKR